jgi:hypothetical protein
MSDSSPATKRDLEELKTELKTELKVLKTESEGRLEDLKNELLEAVRDGQTEILRAFYGFTQSVQQRFAEADNIESSLKKRMTILEDRLLEVEKRLNLPPAA